MGKAERDFNPRSHERSDVFLLIALYATFYFNPRSHERSDHDELDRLLEYAISIHAPTRGATQLPAPRIRRCSYFNPRSHERSDASSSLSPQKSTGISIHAPTRGATKAMSDICLQDIISIHAPTRGATCCMFALKLLISISIHAPTRGATAILHKKFVYFYTIPTINI